MNGTEAVSEDKVAGVQIGGIDVLQQQAVAVGELDEHIVAHLLKGHVVVDAAQNGIVAVFAP